MGCRDGSVEGCGDPISGARHCGAMPGTLQGGEESHMGAPGKLQQLWSKTTQERVGREMLIDHGPLWGTGIHSPTEQWDHIHPSPSCVWKS